MKKHRKVSEDDFTSAVQLLQEKTRKFKEVEERFKQLKVTCTQTINRYFEENGIKKSTTVNCGGSISNDIRVSKVERVSVSFDADKVEKALPRNIQEKVINKKYEINDLYGLVNYLKSCGVSPKLFKSFLDITKTVNVEELERLIELGEVNESDLDGCFSVTKFEPYYKLKVEKGDGDD